MSKHIRLEIPLYYGNWYLPKVWLKIVGAKTQAFVDMNFAIPVPSEGKKISIDLDIPVNLDKIEVFKPDDLSPVDYISMSWSWMDSQHDLRIWELQKLSIIFDDRVFEIPIDYGKPNREEWTRYVSIANQGRWLFFKKWALVVSVLTDRTVGTLYLHSDLIK